MSDPLFEIPETPRKLTERDMLDLLHQRYAQVNPGNDGPRYACAEHVKNAAGFYAQRCVDFIAIDCWPGSGIELHGHEVKVSRSDWLRELKQPEKAEAFKPYMDRWWLVVPDVKIVKPDELPTDWGLLTVSKCTVPGWGKHPARTGFKLRAKTQAPRLSPEQLPREMLATLMRSTAKTAKRRMSDPTCDRCDLAGQIAKCGRLLQSITEVPPSRHAWSDVAVCPTEGCGRQFMFTRLEDDA